MFTRMKGNLLPLEDGSQKTLKVQGLVLPMLSSCRVSRWKCVGLIYTLILVIAMTTQAPPPVDFILTCYQIASSASAAFLELAHRWPVHSPDLAYISRSFICNSLSLLWLSNFVLGVQSKPKSHGQAG